ncbi:Sterol O-acyltransferase 2 (Sterol-ester synthase 2) [Entomophthora muscae]|uniref:Sterol O-acyltransferase 2 (Sterol-ester synthase 2) n=1 Tax=Entomophthora muscae TaxID=34485 RepID=A0ACC2UJN0_9FUNG|nr:Sterol O-acyltransferase 2 (Sterol-ester synthase 2) [Entomophthora muscae]
MEITRPGHQTSPEEKLKLEMKEDVIFHSSYLELDILFNQKNPLRGFFTLFWVIMGFFLLQNIVISVRSTGDLLGKITFKFMSKNLFGLFISDVTMVLSASIVFPIQVLISKGFIPSRKIQISLQIFIETSFVIFWSTWIFKRNWYLIQRASLALHTTVLLMKMHSYSSMNQSYNLSLAKYSNIKAGAPDAKLDPLIESELKAKFSGETHSIVYPDNIHIGNYIDFLLVPSLIYQLEYSRIEKFRPGYFFTKMLALAGTFGLTYIAVEHHLFPVFIGDKDYSSLELVIKLAIPFTIIHLLIFFILFEVVCNTFAELTRFADRNFYDDWWNSHNFLEYSSKWNKPVYRFLRKHVFQSLIETFGLRKRDALILTFLISSLFHELVMCITFQKFTLIFFSFSNVSNSPHIVHAA